MAVDTSILMELKINQCWHLCLLHD